MKNVVFDDDASSPNKSSLEISALESERFVLSAREL